MTIGRPKYQVFISSTYIDLQKEREAVMRGILKLGHIPIGMEIFNASQETQWELIKRRIEESDYYIVIIAHRYGSIDKDGIAYTEKEYDLAVSLGIPTIGFIFNGLNWDIRYIDSGDLKESLEKFKKKVQDRMANYFENPDQLTLNVVTSLSE